MQKGRRRRIYLRAKVSILTNPLRAIPQAIRGEVEEPQCCLPGAAQRLVDADRVIGNPRQIRNPVTTAAHAHAMEQRGDNADLRPSTPDGLARATIVQQIQPRQQQRWPRWILETVAHLPRMAFSCMQQRRPHHHPDWACGCQSLTDLLPNFKQPYSFPMLFLACAMEGSIALLVIGHKRQ